MTMESSWTYSYVSWFYIHTVFRVREIDLSITKYFNTFMSDFLLVHSITFTMLFIFSSFPKYLLISLWFFSLIYYLWMCCLISTYLNILLYIFSVLISNLMPLWLGGIIQKAKTTRTNWRNRQFHNNHWTSVPHFQSKIEQLDRRSAMKQNT